MRQIHAATESLLTFLSLPVPLCIAVPGPLACACLQPPARNPAPALGPTSDTLRPAVPPHPAQGAINTPNFNAGPKTDALCGMLSRQSVCSACKCASTCPHPTWQHQLNVQSASMVAAAGQLHKGAGMGQLLACGMLLEGGAGCCSQPGCNGTLLVSVAAHAVLCSVRCCGWRIMLAVLCCAWWFNHGCQV
jgi:hypothetical protein